MFHLCFPVTNTKYQWEHQVPPIPASNVEREVTTYRTVLMNL